MAATLKDHIDLIREIQKLNPDVTIELDSRLEDEKNEESFFSSVNMSELQLPEGYRVEGNYITNNSAFTSNPMFFSVNDINDVKDIKTNDISKVKDSGYTEEEEKYLADLAAEEDKKRRDAAAREAIEAELNKNNGAPSTGGGSTGASAGRDPKNNEEEEKITRKIVENAKKLSCKVVNLYQRVRQALKYGLDRSAKAEDLGERAESIEKMAVNYNGQTLDDLTVISNLSKKIENNDYMMAILKKYTGNSIEDELHNDPHGLAETMKDVTLVGELHDFAAKDPKFDGATFNIIAAQMVALRRSELHICNRILQQVRYGGITENQMQFLIERINAKGKDFEFDTKKKPEPEKGPETPGGTPGGNPTGANPTGGTDNPSGDNPENKEDTPQAVMLSEADKLKADLMRQYNENRLNLLNKLGDYEKAFIEDATAEGLDLTDNEFIQMMNERAVDKNAIFKYYADLNDLRQLMTFEYSDLINRHFYNQLDDIDKAFVEDAKAENLVPGDNEFNMLLSERVVNKAVILNYYKEIAELQKYQKDYQNNVEILNKLKEFYGKNFTEQNVIEGGRSM